MKNNIKKITALVMRKILAILIFLAGIIFTSIYFIVPIIIAALSIFPNVLCYMINSNNRVEDLFFIMNAILVLGLEVRYAEKLDKWYYRNVIPAISSYIYFLWQHDKSLIFYKKKTRNVMKNILE